MLRIPKGRAPWLTARYLVFSTLHCDRGKTGVAPESSRLESRSPGKKSGVAAQDPVGAASRLDRDRGRVPPPRCFNAVYFFLWERLSSRDDRG
jgi:hypothetical protein